MDQNPTPVAAEPKATGLFGGIKAWYARRVAANREKYLKSVGLQGAADPAAKPVAGQPAGDAPPTPEQILEAQRMYEAGISSTRDLIAPAAMEFTYSGTKVGEMHAKSYFVFDYPGIIDTNWLSQVVNFDVTMDTSMFIYPIDSATIMRFLRNKVAQVRASIAINAEKGNVRDPALEAKLQDAEELRDSLQRGWEKMFQSAMYFTIYAPDEKKLEKISKQLEVLLGGKLIMVKGAFLQSEHAFNSCLPIARDELAVVRNMNTKPLSAAFPFSSSDLTSNEGILYGLNRHNDSLIIFDRFRLENANSVLLATSGAGKSYTVKLEILRSLMLGTDVIVIDPENEYENLCSTVGGAYLKVSLNSDKRINPFDLALETGDEEVRPGDTLRSNIITLQSLLSLMLGKLTPEEEALVDKALIDTYALKNITVDTVNPGTMEPPTFEDFYRVLLSMKGTESLAYRTEKYVTGSFRGLFNMRTNVDLDNPLIVFCIRDLEEQLRPTAMFIILNFIWNRVRGSLKKRLMVIDEAWTMMQHEDSARFLYGLVKRARKYYLGITTITQDVEDFVKSPWGKPIIANSAMQILLKQSPSSMDGLQKIYHLTEGERYLLLNSGIGQGLFFASSQHVAIQVIASYNEHQLVTTNPEERAKKEAA